MPERRRVNKAKVPIRKSDQPSLKQLHELLIVHFREDSDRFGAAEKDHKEFREILKVIGGHIEKSNGFMENLSWLNDISKGTQLLKRPSLWVVAFVLGLAALFGGLKTLAVTLLSWVIPK